MAVTESNYTVSNNSTTNYSFTFPYLKTTDVKLSINGVASSAFTFANATTIQLNSNPTVGDKLRIYRETDDSKLEAEFFAGSAIKSSDLNDNFNQNLYVTQESNNKIDAAWTSGDETIDSTETWASNNTRVATTGAIDGRIDSKIDTALTTDVVGGQSITITDNSPGSGQITASVTAGSIRGTELAGDAVDGTKIADDSIDSEHYVAGSIDLEHMSANSVDSDQYVDGSIDLAHMSANSVDSDQYVDGSIDTAHIADAQVTHVKLANDCIDGDNIQNDVINSEHYAAGSIDTEHIGDLQITTAKVDNGSITTAKIADSSVTTSKIATSAVGTSRLNTGAVTTDKLAADAVDSSKLADNSVDSEHYVDGSIDTAHLGDLQVTTAKIAADAIDGTKLADNAVSAEHIAANAVGDSEIATGALDNRYYTETELDAGQLDNRYYTETESDARYFNVSTGDTIKDGDTFPDNDTTIATTAAINDRIIDLVDDVGGFVPIANETSFPNANPDVNNGTGTIVSIGSLAANHTSNGSGVITIANGTVGNSTVTINGADNNTTYSAGYGMLVETTSTLNTYTFHRLSSKATEVTTVASNITNINTVAGNNTNINTIAGNTTNINTVAGANSNITSVAGSISNVNTVASNINSVNDFSDVYRIASSAPTSHLHEGDLYFDTSSNELKVYNGSSWQGGVTATGNLAGLGANTFTGNQSLGDNLKVQLGAGNDLQIIHDGTDSYIGHTLGSGLLRIDAAAGSEIRLTKSGPETLARFIPDGAVELMYDNAKKFETTSYGNLSAGQVRVSSSNATTPAFSVGDSGTGFYNSGSNAIGYSANGTQKWNINSAGDLRLVDSVKANFGTGDDLQIYHNGSNSYISNTHASSFYIQSNGNLLLEHTNGENYLKGIPNGAVELYYDDSKKLHTFSGGVKFFGTLEADDSDKIKLGDGADLEIYHDGSHSWMKNTTGRLVLQTDGDQLQLRGDTVKLLDGDAQVTMLVASLNGGVELYYDNAKKLETTSSGISVTGNIVATTNLLLNSADDQKIYLGAGNDLQIYHDGSHSYLNHTGTGHLYIYGNGVNDIYIRAKSDENSIIAKTNGAVELYYDNVKTFETNDNGATVYGGEGQHSSLYLYADEGDDNADKLRLQQSSTGDFWIENYASGSWEAHLKASNNGAVELYYDNVKKFETTSLGTKFSGYLQADDGNHIRLGTSDDFNFYHSGNENIVDCANGHQLHLKYGSEHLAKFIPDGAVELYYDGVKQVRTTSTGIYLEDSKRIDLGTGADLQIYFDGSNSYITEPAAVAGQLILQGWNGTDIRQGATGEHMIRAIGGGAVELYYDNAKKLETHASGITVSGTVTANAGSFVDNGNAGPVINISGDDANLWYGRIGNETYHDSVNTGFKFYVTDAGNISFQHHGNAEYKDWSIASHNGTTSQYDIYSTGNGSLYLYYQSGVRLTTTNAGVTIGGTVTDTKGELRTIVQNTQSGAYTLVAADAGKHILASGNITVPDSVFSAGQAITIVNNTSGNLTITKGTNMYNTADGTNANRTLATRGMATLLFTAADTAYISGAGLS